MIRIHFKLPDELYSEAKRIAAEQGISVAEVLRRGLEQMRLMHPRRPGRCDWQPPQPIKLGKFLAPEEHWRELGNS